MKIFKDYSEYTIEEFVERMELHVKGAYILINTSVVIVALGLILGVIL